MKKPRQFIILLCIFSSVFLFFTFHTSSTISNSYEGISDEILSYSIFQRRIEEIMLQMIYQRNQQLEPGIDLASSFMRTDLMEEEDIEYYNSMLAELIGNTIEEDNICAVLTDKENDITIYRNTDGLPSLKEFDFDETDYQIWFKISISKFGSISQIGSSSMVSFQNPAELIFDSISSSDRQLVRKQGELSFVFAISKVLNVDNDLIAQLIKSTRYFEAIEKFRAFTVLCYAIWAAICAYFLIKQRDPALEKFLRRFSLEVRIGIVIILITLFFVIPEEIVYSYMYSYGSFYDLIGVLAYFLFNLLSIYALEFWCVIGWREGFSAFFGKSLLVRYSSHIWGKIKGFLTKIYDGFIQAFQLDTSEKAMRYIRLLIVINAVILALLLMIFGWFSILIYSFLLYWVFVKVSNRLNNDYQILSSNTKKMSQGDLQTEISEDMGIFEPLRYQLNQIREGFLKAINEETRSEKMKTELISNVSHDLKTPLTSLISYIDLLKDEKDPQRQAEYISVLDRQAMRLKILIENLFEVSKANSGNIRLELIDVDLVSLINQALFEMSPQIEAAGLQFKSEFDNDKIIMPLDSEKTYRIIENLISNAVKYALSGSRVYLRVLDQSSRVVISMRNVSKNEIDFDPNDIVERFVRGDSSRHSDGSGLGLAIAKGFAEAQNGSLAIRTDGDYFQVIVTFRKNTKNQ